MHTHLVADTRNFQQVPLSVALVLVQYCRIGEVGQVQLGPAVRPRAKLERTSLDVERIVSHVHSTGALGDDGHEPSYVACRRDHDCRVTQKLRRWPLFVHAKTRENNGGPAICFPLFVLGSGSFQLSELAGLAYGLGLGFWVVFTIIFSVTVPYPNPNPNPIT